MCLPSDALSQHLPSYLGFSYLGRGVSLHSCSSKTQPLLLTLDEGYLFTTTPPDLERGVAPLGHPAPVQPPLLGHGVTGKFGLGIQNEAGQRLIEFFQENTLVIANTLFQQHKRRLYTWISPDAQHQNQIDYILCSQRLRSSIQSAKTRPGTDCGSDHELLIAKLRHKLKKVGKTNRQFRYDLNQISYDYTVEMRNRFKGLDLIECLMNYGRRFVTLYRR